MAEQAENSSKSCPSSWIGPGAVFTEQDFEKLEAKMKEVGKELVRKTQDDDPDFKSMGTKNGVKVHSFKTEDTKTKVYAVRGKTVVKCKKSVLENSLAMYTTERFNHVFRKADGMFINGKVLDYYPPNHKSGELPVLVLKWGSYNVGPMLNHRDFVWAQYWDVVPGINGEKDTVFGVATHVHREEFSELSDQGFVRGELYTTGYVYKELEEELMELSYIAQVDPKGLLPAWAVNMSVKHQAQNVAKMRDWLETLYEATTVLEQNHPSKEPIYGMLEDVHLARRGTHTYEVDTEPGEVVYFRCWSSNGAVKLNISGHSTAQWQGDLSHGSDEKPVIGEVVANASKVTFTWANEGWMAGRKLFYFIRGEKDTMAKTDSAISDGAKSNGSTTPRRTQQATV